MIRLNDTPDEEIFIHGLPVALKDRYCTIIFVLVTEPLIVQCKVAELDVIFVAGFATGAIQFVCANELLKGNKQIKIMVILIIDCNVFFMGMLVIGFNE